MDIDNIKSPTEESLLLASNLRSLIEQKADRATILGALDLGLMRLISSTDGTSTLDAMAFLVPALEVMQSMETVDGTYSQDCINVSMALISRAVRILALETGCEAAAFSISAVPVSVH